MIGVRRRDRGAGLWILFFLFSPLLLDVLCEYLSKGKVRSVFGRRVIRQQSGPTTFSTWRTLHQSSYSTLRRQGGSILAELLI